MHLDKKNVEEASEESANHRAHNRNPPEVVPSCEDLKSPSCQSSEEPGAQVSSWVHGTASVEAQRTRKANDQEANDKGL